MGGDYWTRRLSSEENTCLLNGTGSPEYRAGLAAIADHTGRQFAARDAWVGWRIYTSSIWADPAAAAAKWAAFTAAHSAAMEAYATARRSGPNAPPGWNGPWRWGILGVDGNWHPAPFSTTETDG